MLSSGDVVELDLGLPVDSEAGFTHPAVVVTAQRILDGDPTVIQVVPLTPTMRPFRSEVPIEPDRAKRARSSFCCAVSTCPSGFDRQGERVHGNTGPVVLRQVRAVLALILDLPT